MKLGVISAGRLRRGAVVELVWLAPFRSVMHMEYENTTMDTEISTWQLCKECLILAKGKSLRFKAMALEDSRDSVDVI